MHAASPWEFNEFDTWEIFFFINSQLHLVVFALNRFLAAVRNELLHVKQDTGNCLSAPKQETAGREKINT